MQHLPAARDRRIEASLVFRRGAARSRPITGTKSSLGELRSKPTGIKRRIMDACGDIELTYQMIAERDDETVKIERTSTLVIVAKARIWASEGWQVVITDTDGKS